METRWMREIHLRFMLCLIGFECDVLLMFLGAFEQRGCVYAWCRHLLERRGIPPPVDGTVRMATPTRASSTCGLVLVLHTRGKPHTDCSMSPRGEHWPRDNPCLCALRSSGTVEAGVGGSCELVGETPDPRGSEVTRTVSGWHGDL